jgi:hypothetical protein
VDKIYLVEGHTGEWEDYVRWTVRAFASLSEATTFMGKAKRRADEILDGDKKDKNEYDPAMYIGWPSDRIEYECQEVPFNGTGG